MAGKGMELVQPSGAGPPRLLIHAPTGDTSPALDAHRSQPERSDL